MPRRNETTARAAGLRMRDLVRESGVKRETIHFYLAEGLLPPPLKTGRNTAIYGEHHLRRLEQIRELRDRHFLPLRAIRAVLDGEPDGQADFTPAQRELLGRVRLRVARGDEGADVPAPGFGDGQITREELAKFAELGVIDLRWSGDEPRVDPDGAELLEAWTRMKRAGISPERGFRPEETMAYVRGIEQIVRDEVDIFSSHFAGVVDEDPGAIVEQVIPEIERILAALHRKTLRRFLARFRSA